MSEQSLKEVVVNHDDIEKLETALDCIMYVARTGGHVFMPEDKKDFKPFLLSEIKRFLNEAIEDCIQENPEGAEIYKLKPTEECQKLDLIHVAIQELQQEFDIPDDNLHLEDAFKITEDLREKYLIDGEPTDETQ